MRYIIIIIILVLGIGIVQSQETYVTYDSQLTTVGFEGSINRIELIDSAKVEVYEGYVIMHINGATTVYYISNASGYNSLNLRVNEFAVTDVDDDKYVVVINEVKITGSVEYSLINLTNRWTTIIKLRTFKN